MNVTGSTIWSTASIISAASVSEEGLFGKSDIHGGIDQEDIPPGSVSRPFSAPLRPSRRFSSKPRSQPMPNTKAQASFLAPSTG